MPEIQGRNFDLYISEDQIKNRIIDLSDQIKKDHKESVPLIISILNGSFIFVADLIREMDFDVEVSFVKVKSYEGTKSSGQAKTLIGFGEEINDRDIILLDDIIDTGHTFKHLIEELKNHKPKSIKTCSLLFKKASFKENFKIDYIGFEIENKFVLGYGLDYNERGRNLKDIYVLSE